MVSITIKTKNKLGKICKNVNVKLIRIDDHFYHNPKTIDGITNDDGIVNFHELSEGAYLIQFTKNKIYSEETCKLTGDKTLEITIPTIFGLFRKEKKIDYAVKNKIYEEERTDHGNCFKCKKSYKEYTDKFNCKYCGKYFCANHRLPENHNCWGEPKAPSGAFHETHRADGKVIARGR